MIYNEFETMENKISTKDKSYPQQRRFGYKIIHDKNYVKLIYLSDCYSERLHHNLMCVYFLDDNIQ